LPGLAKRTPLAAWGQLRTSMSHLPPVPYGIKEHVQIVEEALPSAAERQLVFWKTSNKVFRLGLSDTGLITSNTDLPTRPPDSKAA
jgi:hypothetical protein